MSATVRIKTKATDIELIKRMAKQCGWGEVEERRGLACFSIRPNETMNVWRNQISINLQTGEASFDGDYKDLQEVADRIGQEYEAAAVTQQADELGYDWSREVNEAGFPVIYVDVPDTDMEVNYDTAT